MPFLILGGKGMTLDEKAAMGEHLQFCRRCVKDYAETKFIIDLIQNSCDYLIKGGVFSKPDPNDIARELTTEESWRELSEKLQRTEARKRHNRRVRQAKKVLTASGRVAACLVIGTSIFLGFLIYSKIKLPSKTPSQQVALAPKPSVKIELVSENGNILIPTSQQITSTDELKTLVINSKHNMMMNKNTVLAVEPLVEHSHIGCLVTLATGQIYTHVEHDGNPFIVDTAHGQAVITGTTFDIRLTEDGTTLVVSEGTVQFESENGVVNLTTGQTSKIVGQSAPSKPMFCNTAELTAWATGYKAKPALAKAESNTDPWYLSLSLRKEPIVLEETDYDHWVEQKRDWFKQNFPWIFELKDALAKEGIETDYPELLIKSGDVWQFICLDVRSARFSVIDPSSLIKTASNYGFGKQWLLENVPSAKSAMENPVLSEDNLTNLKVFEQWLDYLDKTKGLKPPTLIYSYHASKYLANTRSLIWFAVRDCQYDLTDQARIEILGLLQEEVTAVCNCQNEVLYPEDESNSSYCEDKCQDKVELISTIYKCEKAVGEYIVSLTPE